jgi:tetratricopeptide (TPR) repeat protein
MPADLVAMGLHRRRRPLVSPVPSTIAVDLALADRLYIEEKPAERLRYITQPSRGHCLRATGSDLKVARIQYQKGEHHAASQNAQAFLGTAPEAGRQRQALLLLGYSEMAQGRSPTAEDAFNAYVKTAGPATPYAQLQLAEIAARRGDNDEAIDLTGDALAVELPAAAQTAGLFALARYQESNDDRAAALATYEELAADGETASDRAEALWNLAAVARELRDETASRKPSTT